jgi:hypothetical protein
VALAGNPLTIKPWDDKFAQNGDKAGQKMREIKYEDIRMGDKLGEGASGQVFKGDWDGKEVAVKVFKGQITSDGLPECEMDAMVAAGGAHPNLPKVVSEHVSLSILDPRLRSLDSISNVLGVNSLSNRRQTLSANAIPSAPIPSPCLEFTIPSAPIPMV